jgi:hypothetical protein
MRERAGGEGDKEGEQVERFRRQKERAEEKHWGDSHGRRLDGEKKSAHDKRKHPIERMCGVCVCEGQTGRREEEEEQRNCANSSKERQLYKAQLDSETVWRCFLRTVRKSESIENGCGEEKITKTRAPAQRFFPLLPSLPPSLPLPLSLFLLYTHTHRDTHTHAHSLFILGRMERDDFFGLSSLGTDLLCNHPEMEDLTAAHGGDEREGGRERESKR